MRQVVDGVDDNDDGDLVDFDVVSNASSPRSPQPRYSHRAGDGTWTSYSVEAALRIEAARRAAPASGACSLGEFEVCLEIMELK